jgi:hypothetical protein
VKAQGIDPRSMKAPPSMYRAVDEYFGDLSTKPSHEIRALAEENLVLYATGSKQRPSLSFYDAGEGQLPQDFPQTFCSLVYGSDEHATFRHRARGVVRVVPLRAHLVRRWQRRGAH